MKRLVLLASMGLVACGGHSTETLTYDGHELEPNSIIFARVPLENREFTIAVISDRGDACEQFDGLVCLPQPHVGTTLVFRTPTADTGTRTVGTTLFARWLDFQGVEALEGIASGGRLEVDQSTPDEELGGIFDLTLPRGQVAGEFTAEFCKPMRDYYLGCPDSQ